MIEMGASQRQSSYDVGKRARTRLELFHELGAHSRQRSPARRRYRNQRRPPISRSVIENRFCRLRRLFDDRAGVRATEAERVDGCYSRPVSARPRPELMLHANAKAVEIDVRVWALEMQARRNRSLSHAQGRLDQPGDSSRRFKVADIGLDRTDDANALCPASFAEHRTDRMRFDWITDRSAGTMRLDIADIARMNIGSRAGLPQH